MKKLQKLSDETNRQAAAVIRADTRKYGGLPLAWAELWTARHLVDAEKREAPRPADQLELFRKP